MIIHVKRKHIRAGHKCQPRSCPIALAIEEQWGCDMIYVDENQISIDNYNGYHIPRSVVRFIRKFDKKGKVTVRPFNFKLVYIPVI